MTKIRLKRVGRHHLPCYHIVVTPDRSPRDGYFIEKIGNYQPLMKTDDRKKKVTLDLDRYEYWIKCGAQPTEVMTKLAKLAKLAKEL